MLELPMDSAGNKNYDGWDAEIFLRHAQITEISIVK
jgi:hypothetical protein